MLWTPKICVECYKEDDYDVDSGFCEHCRGRLMNIDLFTMPYVELFRQYRRLGWFGANPKAAIANTHTTRQHKLEEPR